MKRTFAVIVCGIAVAAALVAVYRPLPVEASISGTITAVNGTVVFSQPPSVQTIALQLTGTWTATVLLEATVDSAVTWFQIPVFSLPAGALVTTGLTANGNWVAPVAGYDSIRARASLFTSGTITVTIASSAALNGLLTPVGGGGTGGTSSTFGAAFPSSGTAAGFIGSTGNMAGGNLDASGRLIVNCGVGCAGAAGDTVGTTVALNGAGVTASVSLAATNGVGVFVAAGSLTATLTPELSYDGGTTWVATLFYDPIANTTSSTLSLTNPNAAATRSILQAGGASTARVRVSSFTTGTANATLRATANFGAVPVTVMPGVGNIGVTVSNATLAVTQSGTWTVQQGSPPWSVSQSGAWTVTANQGTPANWTVNLQPTVAAADALANPTIAQVENFLFGFNGTTWDRLRSTISNGLQVDVTRVQGTVTIAGTVTANQGTPLAQTIANSWPWIVPDRTASGTVTAVGNTVSIPTAGASHVGVIVTADTNITLIFEGSVDGTNFVTINAYPVGGGASVTTTTATGSWNIQSGGLQTVRVRVTVAGATPTATIAFLADAGMQIVTAVSPTAANLNDTATQGPPNTLVNAWPVKPTDGTTAITVKAASTSPALADTAQVVNLSPNPSPVCTSKVAINQTASTTLITGTASQFLYVCSIMMVSATAQSISVVEGTGTVCATGISAVIGGTTASLALAANGGFAQTTGLPWLKSGVAADNLCLLQSGTGNISGIVTYVSRP